MRRVCLVDDDILVRDALALGLGDAGYQVTTAPGAAAGLDIMARTPVDALVTDINMPGTDGGQLIAEVRARWPILPIVVISGTSVVDGHALMETARQLGADAAIVKPFRARQLVDLLDRLIDERARRGETG